MEDVCVLMKHITGSSTWNDKLEDIVSRCLPHMLGTLPPGAFHDAHQAMLSLQEALNLAYEGAGGNVPVCTSALRTTKCCNATETSTITEDMYTLHATGNSSVSESISGKLSTEDVSSVLCDKCCKKNEDSRAHYTKVWPRTLSIHIPDTCKTGQRIMLDNF